MQEALQELIQSSTSNSSRAPSVFAHDHSHKSRVPVLVFSTHPAAEDAAAALQEIFPGCTPSSRAASRLQGLSHPTLCKKMMDAVFITSPIPGSIEGCFAWGSKHPVLGKVSLPRRMRWSLRPLQPKPFYDSTCMSDLAFVWEKYIYLIFV